MKLKLEKINHEVLYRYNKIGLVYDKSQIHEVNKWLETISVKEGAVYDVEIKQHRKKRSQNANSYMWVLCDKIAEKIDSTKEEIYKEAVRAVGVFHDMPCLDKDVAEVRRIWESNGIGWFTEVFDSKLSGCTRIRFYHGTSLYDSKQMSRVIDYIVDGAKSLDIETMTESEIERMKQQWGAV